MSVGSNSHKKNVAVSGTSGLLAALIPLAMAYMEMRSDRIQVEAQLRATASMAAQEKLRGEAERQDMVETFDAMATELERLRTLEKDVIRLQEWRAYVDRRMTMWGGRRGSGAIDASSAIEMPDPAPIRRLDNSPPGEMTEQTEELVDDLMSVEQP